MSISNHTPVPIGTLVTRGLGALVIALLINFVLGWIALSQDLIGSTAFFRYPAIAVWTSLGIGGATVVYGLLSQRVATPDRTFVRVAAAVLVLSFIPDIALLFASESVTTSEAIGLMALHVPPAIVAVLTLPERS
ncbi:DUF6069 family protein [Halalkalirubrum salinum]|uniref:DUF6069 family protein n=1 Tax=Halalkalirubrum salinum TaxID=2563889 RepID=UPI0010FB2EC3|nr:DUF6069 family protein [Halalkalirubrum salinum]